MLILMFLYFLIAFTALVALAFMILQIGTLMADCPDMTTRAKAAAITIATGYTAIGAGGIVLIGLVPSLASVPLAGLLGALGFATMCLGLGFTHAVATLRAVLAPPAQPIPVKPEQPHVQA